MIELRLTHAGSFKYTIISQYSHNIKIGFILFGPLLKVQTQERKKVGKDVKDQMEFSYLFLKQLPSIFLKSSLDVQHEILGSIFPEKISFSENRCRTKRVNEVAELIRSVNRPFGINKKGQFCKKTKSSYEVAPTGIEPVFKV